jgi:hypothetical protein
MYRQKHLLKYSFGCGCQHALGALFGTAAFAKLIQLGGSSGSALMLRLSMLARNVTTAFAIISPRFSKEMFRLP